jgi:hypothetical protein
MLNLPLEIIASLRPEISRCNTSSIGETSQLHSLTLVFGEQTAQACANACLRFRPGSRVRAKCYASRRMGVSKSWLGVLCLALGLFGLGREYLRSRLPSRFVDSAPSWRKRRILVAVGYLLFGVALLVAARV